MSEIKCPQNPTEAIVAAMERAEEMECVVVLYRMKDEEGVGWITDIPSTTVRLGLIEEGKLGMFSDAYSIRDDDNP